MQNHNIVDLCSDKKYSLLDAGECNGTENLQDEQSVSAPFDFSPLYSPFPVQQLATLKDIRYSQCTPNSSTSDDIFRIGLVPRILDLCKTGPREIQFEACWILINVACTHALDLVDLGVLQTLYPLLWSQNIELLNLVVWVFGNIAVTDGLLESVIATGFATRLCVILSQCGHVHLHPVRMATWVLCNLSALKPQYFSFALCPISNFLHSNDDRILSNCLCAISCLTESSNVPQGLSIPSLLRILELLGHKLPDIVVPALEIIENLSRHKEFLVIFLQGNFIPILKQLMGTCSNHFKARICAIYGVASKVSASLDVSSEVFSHLISIFQSSDSNDRRASSYALLDILSGNHSVDIFVFMGGVDVLCGELHSQDTVTVSNVLLCIENVLRADKNYISVFEKANGPRLLFFLTNRQEHVGHSSYLLENLCNHCG